MGTPPIKNGWGRISRVVSPPHSPQLISSVDPKFLTLTKVDEQIYGEFRKAFGGLRVDVLDPEDLKSEPAKEVGAGGGLTHIPTRGWGWGL